MKRDARGGDLSRTVRPDGEGARGGVQRRRMDRALAQATMPANRQWISKRRPASAVGPEHFEWREGPVPSPKAPTDILEGLEQAPAGLAGMFEGRNKGKMSVRVC
jgi:NADPH-dependent curcumin reductase CurA